MKLHVKSASFSTDNGQISLKLHEHRGRYWEKKLSWAILEEQFPVPRYTVASKIGNNVISLLWQLRCRCNPDHNKFSSLSNTTVVAIFPKLCLWRRGLCSNFVGIGPEKPYRATLTYSSPTAWLLTLPSPSPRVCTVSVRSYADVITKFSRMDR